VIVAHTATPATWPVGRGRYFHLLVDALLGEFAKAPLYADISALGLFSRGRWLRRLIRRPELHAKLVYGSDFPIPPTPLAFWPSLGRRCWSIAGIPSWIDRDVALKEALGVPEHVFARGGDILRERISGVGCVRGWVGPQRDRGAGNG
jgi:uncharacterized protein